MSGNSRVGILGTGIYLPKGIKNNSELEDLLVLPNGFIEQRTGIEERRWANTNETTEYMGAQASLDALTAAGVSKIDKIIIVRDAIHTNRSYSLSIPIIQYLADSGIQITQCSALDICNSCAGFVPALHLAELMVRNGEADHILVVASTDCTNMVVLDPDFNRIEDNQNLGRFSTVVDPPSIKGYQLPKYSAFLWGCGAGAMIIGKVKEKGFIQYQDRGSSFLKDSFSIGGTDSGKGFAVLNGEMIYKFAMTELISFIREYFTFDILVAHQPNPRILKLMAEYLGLNDDQIVISCDKLGNLISASIPVAYHLAKQEGKIKVGNRILFCSFGDTYLTMSGMILIN